jgi:hypothetical protein
LLDGGSPLAKNRLMRAPVRAPLAPLAVLLLVLLMALGAGPACARRAPGRALYQWTDGEGNVRYTSHRQRIPIEHRLAAQPVVATPEDTHGQYWTESPSEPEVGIEAARDDGLEAASPRAPLPAVESPPLATAPPETGTGPEAVAAPEPPAPEPARSDASGAPAVRPVDEPAAARDQRIRELEARVAADQEALKRLIADPDSAAGLRGSPELREISERLPRLQAELQALRAQDEDAAGSAEDDGA